MTDQEKNLLFDFKVKIKQLKARHEAVKQERSQLQQKIESLELIIKHLNQEYSLLEKKYENLKIARMLEASQDESQDAKSKIQKLVREIDKCIALLNK